MDLLTKLNFKNQKEVFVLNAPTTFAATMAAFRDRLAVSETAEIDRPVEFVLAFVTNCEEIQKCADLVLPRVTPDALIWFAYPKKSSKNYRSDISRDNGWEALGARHFEPVRQVAIDDDWSALRFKPITSIPRFTRDANMAISGEGKSRAKEVQP